MSAARAEGKKYSVSLRMQGEFSRRAEVLVRAIERKSGLQTNASEVIRTAIRKGLSEMETEQGVETPEGKPK